ncbi:hypothetical protein D3C73_21740 [compost metagenome]
MQQITKSTLESLLDEFGIKKKLRSELKFISDRVMDWSERDFVAITDRHRSQGVLIAELNTLHVIPFRFQARKASSMTGRIEAVICDFCSTWQRGSNSAVITFDRSDRSSRSYLCCADLLCSLHVRDLTTQAKLSRTQLREQMTPVRRIERLRANLDRIIFEI